MSREDFLIWQYRTKPKARKTIEALFAETKEVFQSALNVIDILNIDVATGEALDLVGLHVGASRVLKEASLKNYFGFLEVDADSFGEGVFYRYGDSLTKSVVLNDDDFRFFIKAKILKNYQDGTLENIINSLRYLTNSNASNVVDLHDMTMNIIVNVKQLNDFITNSLLKLDLLVRPIGVMYRYLILSSDKPFGFTGVEGAYAFGVGDFIRLKQFQL